MCLFSSTDPSRKKQLDRIAAAAAARNTFGAIAEEGARNVCFASNRYGNGEPLKGRKVPQADSRTAAKSPLIRNATQPAGDGDTASNPVH